MAHSLCVEYEPYRSNSYCSPDTDGIALAFNLLSVWADVRTFDGQIEGLLIWYLADSHATSASAGKGALGERSGTLVRNGADH
jgi:hypothetical protein